MRRLVLVAAALLALAGCDRGANPEAYLQEGFSKFQAHDYDGAIQNYEKAIMLGAKSPNAYNMLGLAYRFKFQQTKDPKVGESEIINFQRAVEIDPKYGAAMLNLGSTYYARGNKVEAAVWFKKSLKLNPQNPEREKYEKMIAEGAAAPRKKLRAGDD